LNIEANKNLAPFTTFGIGGPADLLFHAKSSEELARIVLTAKELEVPYFLMGKGANLLIGDRA
jgi:UDP-N-acetylmuramate dehydrogenase